MREDCPIVVIDSYDSIRISIKEVLQAAGYAAVELEPELIPDTVEEMQPALIILELERRNADNVILLLDRLRQCDTIRAIPILATTTDTRLVVPTLRATLAPGMHLAGQAV